MIDKILGSLNLTRADVWSFFKQAVILAIGAVLTYAESWVLGHNWGANAPWVMLVNSFIVKVVQKIADGPVLKATGKQI